MQLAVLPEFCVRDTNVVLVGRVSVSVTPSAGSGPLFATVIVYVTLFPETTVAGPVLVTDTSLDATVVDAVALSLSGFGSFALVTDAVFV